MKVGDKVRVKHDRLLGVNGLFGNILIPHNAEYEVTEIKDGIATLYFEEFHLKFTSHVDNFELPSVEDIEITGVIQA